MILALLITIGTMPQPATNAMAVRRLSAITRPDAETVAAAPSYEGVPAMPTRYRNQPQTCVDAVATTRE